MVNNFDQDNIIEVESEEQFIINPNITILPRFKPKINLAVMASGNGSNFEALALACRSNILDAKISVLIVNKENCLAQKRASKLGIKTIFIDHRNFSSREDFDNEIINVLLKYNIEAIVMAGWMRIVTSRLINHFPNRIINIHPSLLPSFKGTNAIKKAYEAKVKITGCTIHHVISDIDSGEIIIQSAVKVNDTDTLESLTKKIQSREHKLIPIAVAIAAIKWRKESYG